MFLESSFSLYVKRIISENYCDNKRYSILYNDNCIKYNFDIFNIMYIFNITHLACLFNIYRFQYQY